MLKMITKLVLKWCSIVIFAQNEEVSKGFNLRENEKVGESKIFFSNNVENDLLVWKWYRKVKFEKVWEI